MKYILSRKTSSLILASSLLLICLGVTTVQAADYKLKVINASNFPVKVRWYCRKDGKWKKMDGDTFPIAQTKTRQLSSSKCASPDKLALKVDSDWTYLNTWWRAKAYLPPSYYTDDFDGETFYKFWYKKMTGSNDRRACLLTSYDPVMSVTWSFPIVGVYECP